MSAEPRAPSARALTPQLEPPIPPGMYRLAGQLYIRRFAPVRPAHVSCRLGHHVKVHGRPLVGTQQCDYHYRPGDQRCPAHLWLCRITDLRYWLLDITAEEDELIHRLRMDEDDVIAHFGLDIHPAM